jgi:hypothetical protein
VLSPSVQENAFAITGTLRYSPKLLGGNSPSPNWWLILNCDPEIGKYFRHLHYLHRHRTEKLHRPAWAEHVTVIRNEQPPNPKLWEAFSGQQVEIKVLLPAQSNGYYVWLPVQCDYLLDLREGLGLPRHPVIPLHLSIGHSDEGNAHPRS